MLIAAWKDGTVEPQHVHTRTHTQLYPYHLQDMMIRGLRMTPFVYYSNMMHSIMASERSYDSLPNFTAADCTSLTLIRQVASEH